MNIIDQVRATIDEHGLFDAGEHVVVGVSGGPDSLTLLHVLRRLHDELEIALHVAHLDHAIRPESGADAEFVADLAAEWGLTATVERQDVPAQAEAERFAIEQAARRARYRFLARVAADVGARAVAVGHNADDQVETVLMHLIRGSGLAGLRGMQPRSPYPLALGEHAARDAADWLVLVRPLLTVPRSAIEAYVAEHGLSPCFDRSNLDTTFFRNRLRHELIPELETYNPNIREVVRRTARIIADEYDYLLEQRSDDWERIVDEDDDSYVFDLEAWRELHPATQRGLLRHAIRRLRRELRDIDWVHIENARQVANEKPAGSEATLPAGLALFKSYDTFTVGEARPVPDWPLLHVERLRLDVPGRTPLPGTDWLVIADIVHRDALTPDQRLDDDPWQAVVDAAAAGTELHLRTRNPGDRFQPFGMDGHTQTVADFMIGAKIPHHVRDRLPLVVNAEDETLWLPGWRLDEGVRVIDATDRVITLRFIRV